MRKTKFFKIYSLPYPRRNRRTLISHIKKIQIKLAKNIPIVTMGTHFIIRYMSNKKQKTPQKQILKKPYIPQKAK